MSAANGTSPPVAMAAPLQMSLRALLTEQMNSRRRDIVVDEFADMPALEPMGQTLAWQPQVHQIQHSVLEQQAQAQVQRRLIEQQRVLQGFRAAHVSVPSPPSSFAVAVEPVVAAATIAAETTLPQSPAAAVVPPQDSLPVAVAAVPSPRRRSARLATRIAAAMPLQEESSSATQPVPQAPVSCSSPGRTSTRGKKRKANPENSQPKKRKISDKKPPPSSSKSEGEDDVVEDDDRKPEAQNEPLSCRICMCEIEKNEEAKIDGCSHRFCYSCIGKWAERENTCPLCKQRFSKISRVRPMRRQKGGPSVSNVKRVKQRDQRSDLVSGANWGELLATIAGSGVMNGRVSTYFVQATRMNNVVMNQAPRRTRAANFSLEDNLFDSDDDESEDGAMTSFMNAIMRSQIQHQISVRANGASAPRFPAAGIFGPMGLHPFYRPSPTAASRSHAVNDGDQTAGQASNPLQIDSDDEDDDVQVVEVPRST